MFKSLKSKLTGLFKKEEKPEVKKEKKTEKKKEITKKKTKASKKEIKVPEKIEETFEEKQEPEEKKSFFSKLRSKITHSALTKEHFDELFDDLEITLLESNVALSVIDKIRSSLEESLVGKEIKKSDIDSTILNSLKESISNVLIEPPNLIDQIKEHKKSSKDPYLILFFGINGSGKTTSIAKLANYLKSTGLSVCLAAGDTFRAASIEQLETHASKLDVPIIKSSYGSDPASVAFEAMSYAKKNSIDIVLVDTAGRMYTSSNLMKEMEKIIRISKPNLKIFVGESITGNDATEQAKAFNDLFNVQGIILTKADIDEKAGTILSVSHVTKAPIYFLGTGQAYDDLTAFSKSVVLKNLGLE